MTTRAELKPGDKVVFTGSHPWAGHTGTYLRHERVGLLQGDRPRFKVDDAGGRETFASPATYKCVPK